MSESPVGLIERFFAAINEGVARGEDVDEIVARVADWVDPQLEYVNPSDAIEGGTRHGLDGLAAVAKNSREAGIHRWEASDLTAEGDSVACRVRLYMVGTSSVPRHRGNPARLPRSAIGASRSSSGSSTRTKRTRGSPPLARELMREAAAYRIEIIEKS
jgi:hypothetical protein